MGGESGPVVNLVGERVALGPLHGGLLPWLVRWDGDFETLDLGGELPKPWSPEASAAAWEKLIREPRPGRFDFAIYRLPDLAPIGALNLRDVGDSPHRTAEFGITIGERNERGKGYGTEATRLALGYAFRVLAVHNVLLDTTADNAAALGAYCKAGFKEIGRRREAFWRDGRAVDVVFMDCLSTDFLGGQG